MVEQSTIWIRWSYVAFHSYPDAPDVVAYLRQQHRHTFNIHIELNVDPSIDRELEFHMVKTALVAEWQRTIVINPTINVGSCEHQATVLHRIIDTLYPNRCRMITVDEDGECGSTLYVHSSSDTT